MKKKEIDLFNILLGIIVGSVLGYFVFTQVTPKEIDHEQPVIKEEVYGTVYTIQLGSSNSVESLSDIKKRLDVLGIYYELYEEGGKYYIFNSIYSNLEQAQNKKQIMENYGFTVTIRSDYILDLPKNITSSIEEYEFYSEVLNNLLNSLNNQTIIISEKYYNNPIDIQLFSNITLLMNIKNEVIKENYQINTFCILLKKLK